MFPQYGTYGPNSGQYPGGPGTPGQYPSGAGTPGTPGYGQGGPGYPGGTGPDAYRGPDGQAYVGGAAPVDGSQDPNMKTTTINVVMNMNGPPPGAGGDPQVIIYILTVYKRAGGLSVWAVFVI